MVIGKGSWGIEHRVNAKSLTLCLPLYSFFATDHVPGTTDKNPLVFFCLLSSVLRRLTSDLYSPRPRFAPSPCRLDVPSVWCLVPSSFSTIYNLKFLNSSIPQSGIRNPKSLDRFRDLFICEVASRIRRPQITCHRLGANTKIAATYIQPATCRATACHIRLFVLETGHEWIG